jgi:putative heme-binding domain-containing protein
MWAARIGFSLGVGLALASGISPAQQTETQIPGDPVKGQAIFEGKGGCLSCHRVADEGSLMGPDLSAIATGHTIEELRQALLDPNPDVQPRNQLYRVETADGKATIGRILNQDRFSLQMLDSDGRLRAFQKSNLRQYGFTKTAPMPSYRDKLTPEEQTDLIAFLASLK